MMSQGWGEDNYCYSRSGEDIVKPLQVRAHDHGWLVLICSLFYFNSVDLNSTETGCKTDQ